MKTHSEIHEMLSEKGRALIVGVGKRLVAPSLADCEHFLKLTDAVALSGMARSRLQQLNECDTAFEAEQTLIEYVACLNAVEALVDAGELDRKQWGYKKAREAAERHGISFDYVEKVAANHKPTLDQDQD